VTARRPPSPPRGVWLAIAALALLPSCGAFFPSAQTLQQRLARMPQTGLPLDAPVSVRWNSYGVPWVEASSDHDLAFTLGLVQAHLREGQLAIAKRIAYGRLSEMAGPFVWDFDRTLRAFDFPHAAGAIEARMPPATHAYMQAFVDGLNWYQDHVRQTPPEYGLLGISRERWTMRDLLAIGRVAGTDINWLTFFGLMRDRATPEWRTIWDRVLAAGSSTAYSFGPGEQAALGGLLAGASRSGSNCVVVSPAHSATGHALLATDPHLALILPNLWILAGARSPSFNVVGLMPVGLPIFGLGRTPAMAWGGTNMRAAASDLYDVTGETLTTETQTLRTRLWFGDRYDRRRSELGPIISDSPLFHGPEGRDIALRWMGHEASDEITAFLDASRATTPEQFRAAFKTYAAGGQNMQFADARGNIGQIMAVWLPRRQRRVPPDVILDPHDPLSLWQGHEDATTLPWALNPPEGFLASANNVPTTADVPVGYFYITGERVRRLQQLLASKPKIGLEDLRALQVDVTSLNAIALRDGLVQAIEREGLAEEKPDFLAGLRAWNGSYDAGANGPVLFETLLYHIAMPLSRTPANRRFATDWTWTATYLLPTVQALPDADRRTLLRDALDAAAKDAADFPTWGDMHHMRVRSVFGLIPVIGSRFVIEDYATSGSRETVMKAAHGLVRERHYATYGSQSRFLADMGDDDANWFVLFGGEDGWMGSANFADQMPLWRENRTIRMPLRPATIAAEFPHQQTLTPGRSGS